MTEELKNCPFCGGEAEMGWERNRYEQDGKIYQVNCEPCGVKADAWRTRKQDAIETWNTRADKSEATIKELLEGMAQIRDWIASKDETLTREEEEALKIATPLVEKARGATK